MLFVSVSPMDRAISITCSSVSCNCSAKSLSFRSDIFVEGLSRHILESPFQQAPGQGRFRHDIRDRDLFPDIPVDEQDGFQDLAVPRRESGRGHPADDPHRLQDDVLRRERRIRNEPLDEIRRPVPAVLDIHLDAGQRRRAAQVAQRLVVVHPDDRYLFRHPDSRTQAGLEQVVALVVVTGHDGDGLGDGLQPFAHPVPLVVPDRLDILQGIGIEGRAEAGRVHLPPEPFVPFVRPADVLEPEKAVVAEAPVNEKARRHPSGADVIARHVRPVPM